MTTPSLLGSFSRAQTTYPGGTPTYNSYTDTLPAGTNRVAIIRVARSKFNSVWSGATATVDLGGGPITATYIAKTASSYSTEEVAWQCALGTSGSAQSSTWKIEWGVNTETIGAFSIEVWGNVDQTTPVASSADDHATSTAFSSSATCPADSACSAGVTGNFTAEVAGTGVTVALSQISTGTSTYKHAVAYRIGAAPSLTLTGAAVFSALSVVLNDDGVVPAPTLSSPTGTGGAGSGSGTVVSDQTGTLYYKASVNATEADPGAGSEAGAGWLSTSLVATTNSVSFGALSADTYYGHYLGVNAGGRSAVANSASFVVTAGGGADASSVVMQQAAPSFFQSSFFGNRR